MNFLLGLLATIVLFYFGMDSYLGFQSKARAPTTPQEEKALVQNMAKFLETSPEIQKKIENSGHAVNSSIRLSQAPSQTGSSEELSKLSRFFGTTPTDEFYKNHILKHKATDPNDADAHAQLLIEFSEYMTKHPQESIECLETALQSIPSEMKSERDAIIPVFIHSAIFYVENIAQDEAGKKAYINRFLNSSPDPLVRGALETHFSELLSPIPEKN